MKTLGNRRVEAAEGRQVANQIVEVAVADSIGPEGGHERSRAGGHGLQRVLLVSLDPLVGVHDLDREQVFVLLHAPNRGAFGRVSVTGS
jgi:hypothetical protein